jgi:hypothetical protein
MARIRSVHPGLFTDEAFAQLSDAAQILWIGIWTEADDQGVFEWKPTTLKMRLKPASTTPVEPILAELVRLDCIRKYDLDGKSYGAVRNFARWQRPKRPNVVHHVPPELRFYLGLTSANPEQEAVKGGVSSELKPVQGGGSSPKEAVKDPPVPTMSEIPIQMKEEGGKRKEVGGTQEPSLREGRAHEAVATRGQRLPENWTPGTKGWEYATKQGLNPKPVWEKFRDHWRAKAGADARKVDWQAAWRNWCRNEATRQGIAPPVVDRASQPTFLTGALS